MNEKTKLIFFGSVMVLILLFGTILYNSLQNTVSPTTPQSQELVAAPDFTVVDKDGKEVRLSDYKGKAVVVNFWASWCGYCVEEMPIFEKHYKEQGTNVEFLMVNATDGIQETKALADALIAQEGYTFPVYYDTAGSAASAYKITGLPMTCFINKDGNIALSVAGRISEDKLVSGIDLIK